MNFVFFCVIAIVTIAIISGVAVEFMRIKCPHCKCWMKYHFDEYEDCVIWTCPKCGKKIRVYG